MKKFLLTLALGALTLSASAYDYYLVGDFQGWSLSNAVKFEKVSDDVYQAHVAAINTNGMKILRTNDGGTPGWGSGNEIGFSNSETKLGVNRYVNVNFGGSNMNLVTGLNDAVVEFNSNYMSIHVVGKPMVENWYLVGGFNSWNIDDPQPMVLNEATGCYETEVAGLPANFKIVNNKNWNGANWGSLSKGMRLEVNKPFYLSNTDNDNIMFYYGSIDNAVVSFDPTTCAVTVSGEVNGAGNTYPELYLRGAFDSNSGWDWVDHKLTVDAATGIYTTSVINISDRGGNNYGMKVATLDWGKQWGCNSDAVMNEEMRTLTLNGIENNNNPGDIKSTIYGQNYATFNIYTNEFTLTQYTTSGIDEVEAVEAAPVYYNLQGVRVANPQNGVFIKVAVDKVSKVRF